MHEGYEKKKKRNIFVTYKTNMAWLVGLIGLID